jgi:AraC-like DNA-binding protein
MDKPNLVASAYAQLFLRGPDASPEQLLEGTGLGQADLTHLDFIDARQVARLLRNLDAASSDPAWAPRMGEKFNISTHGPLGFAALSAPTLGEALQVMAEYHAVRITTITAELQQLGNRFRFCMSDLSGDTQYARWIMEVTLRVLESLVETIVGHPLGDNVLISFSYPAPDYAEQLAGIYGTPCEFGAAHNAITMPASWRHIPSPLYDESTYRANIAKCREIIARQDRGGDPVQTVRNILATHFDRRRGSRVSGGPPPGLEAIAARMHLTPRTLIRRLKRAGSPYKSLLEEARVDCAEQLLGQASLTVAEVGEILGYSDPANFGRAFRKWKGVTPAAWRRGQRSG